MWSLFVAKRLRSPERHRVLRHLATRRAWNPPDCCLSGHAECLRMVREFTPHAKFGDRSNQPPLAPRLKDVLFFVLHGNIDEISNQAGSD